MYKKPIYQQTTIDLDNTKPGETIENKVTRLIENKEPIKDGAPIIFTDRAHGVNPAYNIRTDRWEIAVDALTRIEKSKTAKKDELAKSPGEEAKVVKGDFTGGENVVGKQSGS
ncbi:MAG: hypothetical protein [Microviridae sp.]|nr:MAG: hypothetical protein [Microviridae sp.]